MDNCKFTLIFAEAEKIKNIIRQNAMKEEEKGKETVRQPYRKPLLEEVKLLADEVVLTACKGGVGITGPGRPAGQQCVHPAQGPCSSIGNS